MISKQDYLFKHSKLAKLANPKENLIKINKEEGKTQKKKLSNKICKKQADQLSVPVG